MYGFPAALHCTKAQDGSKAKTVFKSVEHVSECFACGDVTNRSSPFRETTIALIGKRLIHHMKYVPANERDDG
jgi:hypothetical protein